MSNSFRSEPLLTRPSAMRTCVDDQEVLETVDIVVLIPSTMHESRVNWIGDLRFYSKSSWRHLGVPENSMQTLLQHHKNHCHDKSFFDRNILVHFVFLEPQQHVFVPHRGPKRLIWDLEPSGVHLIFAEFPNKTVDFMENDDFPLPYTFSNVHLLSISTKEYYTFVLVTNLPHWRFSLARKVLISPTLFWLNGVLGCQGFLSIILKFSKKSHLIFRCYKSWSFKQVDHVIQLFLMVEFCLWMSSLSWSNPKSSRSSK